MSLSALVKSERHVIMSQVNARENVPKFLKKLYNKPHKIIWGDYMRKVELSMNEEQKYLIIKKLLDTNGNKKRAAIKIGCSGRHINRMIQGYIAYGKEFFVHGNKGRTPVHAFDQNLKNKIILLYKTKYQDSNIKHFSELLLIHEQIKAAPNTINKILKENFMLSPKARKITKKNFTASLKKKMKTTLSCKEKNEFHKQIVAINDAHPRRPRSAFFGEMIQMDASQHLWFGDKKTYLHLAIDDSTGHIVAAYFDKQETLKGYYNTLYQILKNHGIPYMFYTDRRTVFEYKQKKSPSIENDTFTQFSYACKELGIVIKTTSIPQAKGRVERVFGTLQSRLPIELRMAGATTIEQANVFLNSYIKKHNAMFALKINHNNSVFELQPDDEKINLTLAIIAERQVDNGHCIKFNNKFFKTFSENGMPIYYHKGTKCLVIKAFDGNLFASINENIYALEEIPLHENVSKNFYIQPLKEKPVQRYVPPMHHPWKKEYFSKFVNEQKSLYSNSFKKIASSEQASEYFSTI